MLTIGRQTTQLLACNIIGILSVSFISASGTRPVWELPFWNTTATLSMESIRV